MEKYERIELHSLAISVSLVDGSVILVEGAASIFGCPLRVNVRYRLVDRSITIDAYGKARIDLYGTFSIGMPRPICSDLHELDAILAVRRTEASLSSAAVSGPVVLVVGDSDTGKSTSCITLANLATATSRNSRKNATESLTNSPMGVAVVDLDVGQGSITAPGCISAAFVEAPIPIDEGFAHMTPAAFYFGDKVVTPSTRKRYLDLCSLMHQSIRSVMSSKDNYRCGGILVNTMGWVRDLGYELLQQLVSIFQATHVVVTAGTNLDVFDRLKSDFAFLQDTVTFHRLSTPLPASLRDTSSNSSGSQSVGRSGLDRARLRNSQIHAYFFGSFRNPLSPIRAVVFLKDVVLLHAVTLEELSVKQLRPLMLAAVSTAPHRELCASCNVAGFVIITDIGKTTLSLLSPAPGKLPRPFLLVSPTIAAVPDDIPPFGAVQQA